MNVDQLRAQINGYRQSQFSIGGINFEIDLEDHRRLSTPDNLMTLKHWDHVDVYLDRLAGVSCDRLLEFGIHQGGSTLMYHQLLQPEKLVAIDISNPVDAAVQVIDTHKLGDSVRLYFNQDQANTAEVTEIIEREFDGPLDVVIDDASHFYEQTRASFNTAFPYVRPGGLYMIEDWGWAHWTVEPFQDQDGYWRRPGEPALSNLIFQLTMMCASHPELISHIEIFMSLVVVHRGPADVPHPFEIDDYYKTQGRPFELL